MLERPGAAPDIAAFDPAVPQIYALQTDGRYWLELHIASALLARPRIDPKAGSREIVPTSPSGKSLGRIVVKSEKCPGIRWDTLARLAHLPYLIASCKLLILRCQPEPHWAAHDHQWLLKNSFWSLVRVKSGDQKCLELRKQATDRNPLTTH